MYNRRSTAMTGRLMISTIAAVIALYVLVSMAAALARFPGQAPDARGGYEQDAAITVTSPETGELRTEKIVP